MRIQVRLPKIQPEKYFSTLIMLRRTCPQDLAHHDDDVRPISGAEIAASNRGSGKPLTDTGQIVVMNKQPKNPLMEAVRFGK